MWAKLIYCTKIAHHESAETEIADKLKAVLSKAYLKK